MKYGPFLKSFRLENFKAIQDSGAVRFTPLTVLIGNNGSGKSSLVEGLETCRSIIVDDLDAAMERWFGIDHVWNKRVSHQQIGFGLAPETHRNPLRFAVAGRTRRASYRSGLVVNARPGGNGIFIQEESGAAPEGFKYTRDSGGKCKRDFGDKKAVDMKRYGPGESAVRGETLEFVKSWQFLSMLPDPMGRPSTTRLAASGPLLLNRDGSNLAQYLVGIRKRDTVAFDGIVEAMRFVLDYAENFEPVETQEIQRMMYVQMREGEFEIPAWVLSTGTLRILALLAVLRNPEPPPLLVVEEIENGLDPRTLHLVLEEIRDAVQSKRTQIILTTHSPYFLDLVPLETLILVQRDRGGDPVFWRPSDSDEVQSWAKSFAPGQLYTTGRFKRGVRS